MGFTALPLVVGIDKFFDVLTNWEMYLADWVPRTLNVSGQSIMYGVGVIEIAAGLGVAMFPRVFAYIVAAWLLAIVINLITAGGFYDIALRDAGLMLGALALARLSHIYARRSEAPAMA